eukprot:CAMPEP_0195537068 /NCGR_PEP_ID=MMETSP0794_2-20130614/47278_1 /TAXON_ID=515487 /ORGANISM="Stephanopyxis turris, Strain CCMP 815" /LENGTH=143 /DNA_ID=CAMNT_0040670689 /DNA_START=199 /DNA_END=626 /DNA_ORIENTATION=-
MQRGSGGAVKLADGSDKKRKIKWNTEPYLSIMKHAVELAMKGSSTTKVASQFTIPARTLRRYVAAERRAHGDFTDMRGHGNTDGPRKSKANRKPLPTSAKTAARGKKKLFHRGIDRSVDKGSRNNGSTSFHRSSSGGGGGGGG